MGTSMSPYDNRDVRLAMKRIIDRKQWLKKIINGYGELGNDNPIGPANIYRATADELPQLEYDPEKAKFHLKKTGLNIRDHCVEHHSYPSRHLEGPGK